MEKQSKRAEAMGAQSFIRLTPDDHDVIQEAGKRLRISLSEIVRVAALPPLGLGSPKEDAMHDLVCRTAREIAAERQPAA